MAISILDALEIIYQEAKTVSSEIIPMESAVDRIVAREYLATLNLPRFDNSAMDGYAIKCRDEGKRVICKDVIYAGDKALDSVSIGSAIKIMTGAPIPRGADSVVPIENVRHQGEWIELPSNIKESSNIRFEGEDIRIGDRLLGRGESIKPYTIALLASQGMSHIEVYRKPRVAVFSTGNELAHHYETLHEAQLYNSNAPAFVARAKALGCDVSYVSASADSIEAIKQTIAQTLHCDLIITSGGVSVGDRDFTKEAFKQMGMEVFFEKVDIKPGKPTTFGKIDTSFVVNLPGNPLASAVNFEIFIKPLILHLQGALSCYHGVIHTLVDTKCNIKGGQYSVLLGQYDGMSFTPLSKQSPGMVLPLHLADGMVVVAPEVTHLKHSQSVKMIPITLSQHASKKINFINH